MPRVEIRKPDVARGYPAMYINYEAYGNPSNPAILFVEGLGATLASWPTESLIKPLASAGYYCIIYDNRDSGCSSYITYRGNHSPVYMYTILCYNFVCPFDAMKIEYEPAYVLKDMAEDGIRLLDALKIQKAHLVGRSMGGMIAQLMAIFWQDRFCSFCIVRFPKGVISHPYVESQLKLNGEQIFSVAAVRVTLSVLLVLAH